MIWLPITVTGNGRQVVAATQLLTSGFSIQLLKLRNLIKTCSILKKWNPDFQQNITPPIVQHEIARQRALQVYKKALQNV